MKRLFIAIFSLLALSSTAQELSVCTFNIRCGSSRKPGVTSRSGDYKKYNGWDDRKQQVCDMINFEAFDLFGVQEARPGQMDFLEEQLPDYKYVGVGRDDGDRKGEHCAIFYRKSRFKLLESGNFWLSETPDEPSFGWGARYRRVCTWGLFKDKQTKKLFYFINTHVNWGLSSKKSAEMLVEFVKEKCTKSDNVIMMADFNATQTSELYQIITSNGLEDTYNAAKYRFAPTGTGCGFNPRYYTERRIDHIFVSEGIKVSRYGVLTYRYFRDVNAPEEEMDTAAPKDIKGENRETKTLSDHNPIQSFITLK